MSKEKGTEVVVEEYDSLPDKQHESPVCLVVDLHDGPTRSRDELKRELEEFPASSVQEICQKVQPKITGQYKDVDGNTREAAIAVVDESTFTPNGITLGDDELFNTYISLRTFENVARYFEERNRSHLTDAEEARLRATAEILEKSLEENK